MYGISVIVARLGWCPRTRAQVEEIAASEWARDIYFSPGDAGRFCACAIEDASIVVNTVASFKARNIVSPRTALAGVHRPACE